MTVDEPYETRREWAMQKNPAGKAMTFGRDEADWDVLASEGEEFLIERARLGRLTSYTELNTALERRTGIRGASVAAVSGISNTNHGSAVSRFSIRNQFNCTQLSDTRLGPRQSFRHPAE